MVLLEYLLALVGATDYDAIALGKFQVLSKFELRSDEENAAEVVPLVFLWNGTFSTRLTN